MCKTHALGGFPNLFLAFPRLGIDRYKVHANEVVTLASDARQLALPSELIENARLRVSYCTGISTALFQEKSRP